MNYKLNKKNIKKFIDNSDNNVKNIIKKILKNTKYISKKFFFNQLRKNIKYLIKITKKNKYLYIIIDENNKNKSNYWVYLYLKKILKTKLKILNYENDKYNLKNNDYIIFVDDCIYTGNQLGAKIANFIDLEKDKFDTIKKINLFILVPFISCEGKKYIKNIFKYNNDIANKKFKLIFNKYTYILKSSNKILTKDEIELMNKYYPRIKNINDTQRYYFNDKYFIYFNHKLADATSTITLFYKGLVPNTHNLNILSNYQDNDYAKLIIYPLISNCIYHQNFNNECPIPPYKK